MNDHEVIKRFGEFTARTPDGTQADFPRFTRETGGEPHQLHPGTRFHCCGCSLPGLTGFTAKRCEGTDAAAIEGGRTWQARDYARYWGHLSQKP